MSEKEMNIFQRMLAITSELKTVAKNLTVSTGTGSYKAVSEVDVLNAVRPLEEKYGVYSYPCKREVVDSGDYEKESKSGYKSLSRYLRVKTVYRFVNVDDTGDYIETTTFADGIDTGDKATGKAMTYGDKYALMKAYKIKTGDDPDQVASEEYSSRQDKEMQYIKCSELQVDAMKKLIADGITTEEDILSWANKDTLENLTIKQASAIIQRGKEKQKSESN